MKRKLLYVSMVVLLLVMQILPVVAKEAMVDDAAGIKLVATDTAVKSGEQVDLILSHTGKLNNINTIGIEVEYDKTKLELVSGEWLIASDKTKIKSIDIESASAAWAGSDVATTEGKLMKFTFRAKEDLASAKLDVKWNLVAKEDNVDRFTKSVLSEVMIVNGVNLSGNCVSFGTENAKVSLYEATNLTNPVQTVEAENGQYQFSEVNPGSYVVKVTKEKSAPRVYDVTVVDQDLTQNVAVYQYGDVNMDGSIDSKDLTDLAKHTGDLKKITDDYQLSLANVRVDAGHEGIGAEDLTDLAKYLGDLIKEFQVYTTNE